MKLKLAAIAMLLGDITAEAQEMSTYDMNKPWGWCNCASSSSADGYTVTGGQSGSVTLTNNGGDMKSAIESAIKKYAIVILDGSAGDFTISSQMSISTSNRTIVGINGARLCTEFTLTEAMRSALDNAGVKKANTSGGGGTLTNGTTVKEEAEYLTRQTLIDLTGDSSESYRNSGIFNIKNAENIIIRNIKFVGPGACDLGGADLITAQGVKHMWVDHCEFTDGQDGNFDIVNESDFITVSWCKFNYTSTSYIHMNTNLVGNSDSKTSDKGKLNVTYAYCNWGAGCNQRMPMVRFGTIHIMNCYFSCANNANAVNARKKSKVYVERCYFDSNVTPYKANNDTDCDARVSSDCHSEKNVTWNNTGSVTIPYLTNTVTNTMSVDDVPTEVGEKSGATLAKSVVIGTNTTTATKEISTETARSTKYYTLSGCRTEKQGRGINIEVTQDENGANVKSSIVLRR